MVQNMELVTLEAFGCTATVDDQAVTLTHNGLMTPRFKKSAPWVIPLGAIESIDHLPRDWKNRGYVRFVVRDGVGWHDQELMDMNTFLLKKPADEFLQVVEQRRANAHPAAMPAAAPAKQPPPGSMSASSSNASFEGITLQPGSILFQGKSYPVAGARASVEVGSAKKRITATRVLAVGVFALAAKKNETRVYLTIDFADGQEIVVELEHKQEAEARQFASQVTNAGAREAAAAPVSVPAAQGMAPPPPPPPPPSVPAGWYPDPQGAQVQRYWDGSVWTDHTAPLTPPQ